MVSALRGTLGIIAEIASVGRRFVSISGSRNRALSEAIVMSQAVASAQPKPSAPPCTAAITGTGASARAS